MLILIIHWDLAKSCNQTSSVYITIKTNNWKSWSYILYNSYNYMFYVTLVRYLARLSKEHVNKSKFHDNLQLTRNITCMRERKWEREREQERERERERMAWYWFKRENTNKELTTSTHSFDNPLTFNSSSNSDNFLSKALFS